MIDEGYTKFRVDWTDRAPIEDSGIAELDCWRRRLYAVGLIGRYEDSGIGYGNLSIRRGGDRRFVVSGTQTGHLPVTGNGHYALVTDYDIEDNRVSCRGAVQASSESLTHAAIYELDAGIGAVVHVHDALIWERLKGSAPTTHPDVSYGTPEMAREFRRLFNDTRFPGEGIAIMAGHESGIVSIGSGLEQAARRILSIHEESFPAESFQSQQEEVE